MVGSGAVSKAEQSHRTSQALSHQPSMDQPSSKGKAAPMLLSQVTAESLLKTYEHDRFGRCLPCLIPRGPKSVGNRIPGETSRHKAKLEKDTSEVTTKQEDPQ